MYRSALIGCGIGYTKSPAIHALIAEAIGVELDFGVVDVPFETLGFHVKELIKTTDGFFVTKPYKNDVKKYLDVSKTNCGVNFVKCDEKAGYNTDGCGFIRALDTGFEDWRKNVSAALVLGAGGAAYSVAEALKKLGKKVYVLNRTMMNAVKLCSATGAELYYNQPAELIVNATSLGLRGEDALSKLAVMPSFEYAYDLVYSEETPFMVKNKKSGARVLNGADMLIYQAIEGDRLLTGKDIDAESVFQYVKSKMR